MQPIDPADLERVIGGADASAGGAAAGGAAAGGLGGLGGLLNAAGPIMNGITGLIGAFKKGGGGGGGGASAAAGPSGPPPADPGAGAGAGPSMGAAGGMNPLVSVSVSINGQQVAGA